jgi:UDP-glucose 4-epimerase
MRVLVTGGAGYIGSVVNEELLQAGHEVIVYDSLYKGHAEAVDPATPLVRGDLADRVTLIDTLRRYEIEAVVHMAADSLVGESVVDPGKYYRNNVVAGLTLLDAMRECGVARIVFSSTAAVYGEPAKQPIEESDPVCPLNPYGETKLAFERALHWYSSAYGFGHVSLRYFNAAGASTAHGEWHTPETHLIPLVLRAAAGKQPVLEIYGDDYQTKDGTCLRDYIHVSDLALAHVLALQALQSGDIRNGTYNLGCGGEGYTVRQVIEVAHQVTGQKIPVRTAKRRAGDPAVLVAGSEKIKRELGWNPKFQDLSKIVGSAWTWIQAHPDGYAE